MGKGRKAGIVNAVLGIDIKKFSTGLQNAKRQMKGASANFAQYGKVIAGVGAGIGAFAVSVAREYENLNVRLKTAFQGNETAARNAFKTINEFTKKTPFQLNEVADAFIKLKNMGLNPSMSALQSYGNTAAAMGKSLNQMIEAVADAATGEFERLKEFGIKARSEGNKVRFTFRGVTTTVAKNAAEIQKYLLEIGNTDFAGGILAQSETLDGQLSTLRDTIKGMANDLGQLMLPHIKKFVKRMQDLGDQISYVKDVIAAKTPQNELFDAQQAVYLAKKRRLKAFGVLTPQEVADLKGKHLENYLILTKAIDDATTAYKNLIAAKKENNQQDKTKTTTTTTPTTPTLEPTKEQIERAKLLAAAAKDRSMGVIGPMTSVGVDFGDTLMKPKTRMKLIQEQAQEMAQVVPIAFINMVTEVDSTLQRFNEMLTNFTVGTIGDFASAIGGALMGGKDAFVNFGDRWLSNLADFLGRFGEMLIAAGIGKVALDNLGGFGGGIPAIAAGIALKAFSGGINQHLSKSGNAMTGGATMQGTAMSGAGAPVTVTGVIRGSDLHLMVGDQNRRRR